ncbi:chemotaxis protein CheW [Desulfurispira natronophila]|uniref:Chemotaxis signal transduction protein n=1 Tax=Desulfurispira natronophila TaxID=682562 RepID=A0A7W7Y4P0_9BACT|nr:chemotaxis protein CheW [Desulfurispira natronophila]MBB5022033.1 chemotaxis signal transduction protein [Desulfurispira natronophila]
MTATDTTQPKRHDERENLDETLQLVGFKLGEEEYCIDILNIQEINKRVYITRVPKAAPFVKGVINLRGKVITVIDLRKRFALPANFDNDTRIMVIDLAHETMGFVVDSVTEVIRIPVGRVDPTPPLIGNVSNEYLLGVGKAQERLLVIIDLNRVVGFKREDGQYYESALERKIKKAHGLIAEELPSASTPKPEKSEAPAPKAAESAPPPPKPEPEVPLTDKSGEDSGDLDDLIAKELEKREAEDAERLAREKAGGAPATSGEESADGQGESEDLDLDDLIAIELKKREAEDAERLAREQEEAAMMVEDFSDGEEVSNLDEEDLDNLDDLIALELKKREAEDAERLAKLKQIEQEPETESSGEEIIASAEESDSRIDELIAQELKKREDENEQRLQEVQEDSSAGKKAEPLGDQELRPPVEVAPEAHQQDIDPLESQLDVPSPMEETADDVPDQQSRKLEYDDVLGDIMGELGRQKDSTEQLLSKHSMRVEDDELQSIWSDAQTDTDDTSTPDDGFSIEEDFFPKGLREVEDHDDLAEWDIDTEFRWPGRYENVAEVDEQGESSEPLDLEEDTGDAELAEVGDGETQQKKKSLSSSSHVSQTVEYLDELLAGNFSSDYQGDPEIGMLFSRIQSLLVATEMTVNTAREEVPAIIGALYDSSKYAERSTNRVLDLSESILRTNNTFQEDFHTTRHDFSGLTAEDRQERIRSLEAEVDGSIDHVFDIMGAMEFQDITKQSIQKLAKKLADFKATLSDMDSLIPLNHDDSEEEGKAYYPQAPATAESGVDIERDQHAVNSLLRELGIE